MERPPDIVPRATITMEVDHTVMNAIMSMMASVRIMKEMNQEIVVCRGALMTMDTWTTIDL